MSSGMINDSRITGYDVERNIAVSANHARLNSITEGYFRLGNSIHNTNTIYNNWLQIVLPEIRKIIYFTYQHKNRVANKPPPNEYYIDYGIDLGNLKSSEVCHLTYKPLYFNLFVNTVKTVISIF